MIILRAASLRSNLLALIRKGVYFIFVCIRKAVIPLFDRNKSNFEILLREMAVNFIDFILS